MESSQYRELSRQGIEVWLPIPGYEGVYEVSNLGSIKSLARLVDLHNWKQQRKERIRKQSKQRKYLQVRLRHRMVFVHRLVLEAFDRPALSNEQCRHLNGNASDNKLHNLDWGTSQQNHEDQILHGTINIGERNASAKLTECQVIAMIKSQDVQRNIAAKYGVSQTTVWRIKRRKQWKHVEVTL